MPQLWKVGLSPHPQSQLLFPESLASFPTPFSGVGSMFHLTHTVGGRLRFTRYVSQFCSGRGSICPWAVLVYVPRVGVVEESCVVCVAHLLGLQIYTSSFETGRQGEIVCHFSQGKHWDWVQHSGVWVGFPWITAQGCCSV
jgi:hypothetical protein